MSAPFADQVAGYLADCARHAALLNPDHHPTEDGAVKLIWHRGAVQAEQIRAAFRDVAGHAAPGTAPRPTSQRFEHLPLAPRPTPKAGTA